MKMKRKVFLLLVTILFLSLACKQEPQNNVQTTDTKMYVKVSNKSNYNIFFYGYLFGAWRWAKLERGGNPITFDFSSYNEGQFSPLIRIEKKSDPNIQIECRLKPNENLVLKKGKPSNIDILDTTVVLEISTKTQGSVETVAQLEL